MSQMDLSPQLSIVKQSLRNLGYREPNGAVIEDYQFVANDGRLGHADLIAFGDMQLYDLGTACIAVNQWPNGHNKLSVLKDFTYVGVPIALFALSDHVEIWPVSTISEYTTQKRETLSYEELPEYFNTRGRELSPRSLLSAKKGERQLSLFDIDPSLIEFAREATQETLVRQFELAIESTSLEVRRKNPKELNRLAIWILAARILQDKLVDHNELKTTDVMVLLNAVQLIFPNYFTTLQQDLELAGNQAAYQLYDRLSGDFTFRSLTNDMLAYFYENTLVRDEMRKALGIYYTPRDIAQRILHRLPVENFPPEDRTILDGTCGSGNLLLAAYDRLSSLLPAKWSSEQRHNYLLQHLWGIDQDNFACEIARLSLLLYNLPAGDSWQIKAGDVFHVTPQQVFGKQPNVIVGNPPFEEPRSNADKKRAQKAASVLDRYLDWLAPNGLLGIVLPLTFLHNSSARDTRERILKKCDILEIWHLPEKAIPSSSVAIAVILARKLPSTHTSVSHLLTRIDEGAKHNHQLFNQSRYTTTSYVVPQRKWFSDPERQMTSSPLDDIWNRIDSGFIPVDPKFCIICNGVLPGKSARLTHFSEHDEGPGWKPGLIDNFGGEALEPFAIHWNNQKEKFIKYPSDELERQRKPEHFEIPSKLIMNATRNPGSPWRFYAAIDRFKLVVTENFHYVLPQAATLEELAAVFNSMLANAWFSSRNYHRDITLKGGLKRLPFPTFSEQQKKEIHLLVQKISKMKRTEYNYFRDDIKYIIERLDEIIFDAYGLDKGERRQIRAWMNLFPRPGMEWASVVHFPQNGMSYPGRQWTLTGQIEAVDLDRKTVLIWIEGQNDSIEITIPHTMPGWALRPGVAFQAFIPWKQGYPSEFSEVTWLDFKPLDYSYLTEDELISHLAKLESD